MRFCRFIFFIKSSYLSDNQGFQVHINMAQDLQYQLKMKRAYEGRETMLIQDKNTLLDILRKEIIPATGCTEPVAVAYSAAVARQKTDEEIENVEIWVDPGLYKNGMRVGIPGTNERGLSIAGALGLIAGKPEKGMRVIEDVCPEDVESAKKMVEQGMIKVLIKDEYSKLYIETNLFSKKDKVRVVTLDRHLNIVSADVGQEFKPYNCEDVKTGLQSSDIQGFDFDDFAKFSDEVPISDIEFLKEGVQMSLALADEGISLPSGIGYRLKQLVKDGLMSDDLIFNAQLLCSSAAEARMSGSKLPAMSSAGSGNHGITIFLTNLAVAEKKKVSDERLLRALVLSNLVTFYIKSYTGTLSAMCGCGVAAGIGASAGVVYLLGGSTKEMLGAMINMVGSISGLVCDGAKEGCAYKLALSAGWAVQSALLSMKGGIINTSNGILAPDFKSIFKNLGYVCNPGMVDTNKAIIKVMSCQV